MTLTNSSVMEAVTGVSDWEFLKPDQEQDKLHVDVHACAQVPQDQQRRLKNPSLEDFDGELAVFQVTETNTLCTHTCSCTCTYTV